VSDAGGAFDVDRLLDELLALPSPDRRAALAARQDLSPDLRAFVEAVLAESERSDPFLDPAAVRQGPLVADLNAELEQDDPGALTPGTTFAGYEVLALAGRGGMGEVYRARDRRLRRDVALKVLPSHFTGDAARVARFEREARLLASLNHPNIAAIYGVAEDDERVALVLEHVEGPTLAERLAARPLPQVEALEIARQIALALDAAHQQAIVHRDLKPANVKVTTDGTVKVLDFGLARTLAPSSPESASTSLTTEMLLKGGMLGTAAYMAPEQIRGERAGARADIWAFGCVLYEMLTGTRAFEGETATRTLSLVLETDPDLARLPAATPEPVRRLVRKLLVKDPEHRLPSMADAVTAIDGVLSTRGARRWWQTPAVLAGLLALVIGTAGWFMWSRQAGEPAASTSGLTVVRLGVPVPASDSLLPSGQQVAAISPDGNTIVYRAVREGRPQLFARSLTTLQSEPIPGTENAAAPFFSPDGRWVAFDGDGALRKVPVSGGSVVTICEAPGGANASWAGDTIVFATTSGRVLQSVPAAGGVPAPLTSLNRTRGDVSHEHPFLLPDGRLALFTVVTRERQHVAAVRRDTGEVHLLTEGAQPRYLPGGYLVFVRGNALWAAPFVPDTLQLSDARPVLEGLDTDGGSAHFTISGNGSLLYVPAREEVRERRLVWLDRAGAESPLPLEAARYQRAALAPDGRRLAVVLTTDNNTDIWIGDVPASTLERLTRDPSTDTAPLWAPDGRSIVFRSDRDGGGLFRVEVDGGSVTRLTESGSAFHTPHAWADSGERLLFTEFRTYTEQAIAVLDARGEVTRLLPTGRFAQLRPQISPDGRWLAYQSDESGRFEIYVRPYPNVDDAHWRVSGDGGTSPRWVPSGRELLYYDGTGFVSVPGPSGATFSPGRSVRLFDYAPYTGRLGPDYDLGADGARFLVIRPSADTPGSRAQLVLIQNWIREVSETFDHSR
jgi:Tol biopolymer transport system component